MTSFTRYRFEPERPQNTFPVKPIGSLEKNTLLALYRAMVRIRRCELALIEEYHPADEMRCPIHFCVGQEAVSSVLSILLKKEDYLYSHHRSHGYYLAKHAPMDALFAELYGKETGANGGKAGSQDISYHDVRFYSGAILAGAIPIAAGTALSHLMKNEPLVSVAGFGEAATDQGIFWETANYAGLKKLPLVLICENNIYSTFSPQDKRSAGCNIAQRAETFGMHAQTIFGNDVVSAYHALKAALERARNGEGPSFIEAYTYRWNGHVGPEDDDHIGYRSPAEKEFWKRHCPIALLEKQLLDVKYLDVTTIESIRQEVDKEIEQAFSSAKEAAFPQPSPFRAQNWSDCSARADQLLKDESSVHFDHDQKDLIPGPY